MEKMMPTLIKDPVSADLFYKKSNSFNDQVEKLLDKAEDDRKFIITSSMIDHMFYGTHGDNFTTIGLYRLGLPELYIKKSSKTLLFIHTISEILKDIIKIEPITTEEFILKLKLEFRISNMGKVTLIDKDDVESFLYGNGTELRMYFESKVPEVLNSVEIVMIEEVLNDKGKTKV